MNGAFGDWLGTLGASMQGGEDAAMYADPAGAPYATTAGAQNYGAAIGGLVPDFKRGLLLLAGIAIIAVTVISSGED